MNKTPILMMTALAGATMAHGDLVAPVDVTSSQNNLTGVPVNLINDLSVVSATALIARPADGDGDNASIYRQVGGTYGVDKTLTFDMGSDMLLSNIVIWNFFPAFANAAGSGTEEFTLSFATSAEGTGGFGTSISDTAQFNATRAQNSATTGTDGDPNTVASETFDFADVTARYVRINHQI